MTDIDGYFFDYMHYSTLGYAAAVALFSNYSDVSCFASNLIVSITGVLIELDSACFFILRIWAIWGRHWLPLVIFCPLAVFIIVTGAIYDFSTTTAIEPPSLPLPYGSCSFGPSETISEDIQQMSVPSSIQCLLSSLLSSSPIEVSDLALLMAIKNLTFYFLKLVVIACSGALILTVFLAFVATVMKTLSIKRSAEQANMKHSLSTLLMRDGSLYFLSMWIMQLLNIFRAVSELTSHSAESEFAVGVLFALPPILLSRFIFSLRGFSTSGDEYQLSSFKMSSVQFIGNIGAPLVVSTSSPTFTSMHGHSEQGTRDTILEDSEWEASLRVIDYICSNFTGCLKDFILSSSFCQHISAPNIKISATTIPWFIYKYTSPLQFFSQFAYHNNYNS
ncbi:hypothetical protein ABKN59_007548 [Abortiporus biennis]